MLVSDKQWLSRVRGLLQRHCGHFIKGRIELINAKVLITVLNPYKYKHKFKYKHKYKYKLKYNYKYKCKYKIQ